MAFALSLLGLFATKGCSLIVMMIYGIDSQSSSRPINALLVENTTDDIAERHSRIILSFFSLGVVAGSFTSAQSGASPSISFIYRVQHFINIAGMIYVRTK